MSDTLNIEDLRDYFKAKCSTREQMDSMPIDEWNFNVSAASMINVLIIERDALREELRKVSEQEPRGYELVTSNSIEYFSLFSEVCEAAQGGGDVVPVYVSPVPAMPIQDDKIRSLVSVILDNQRDRAKGIKRSGLRDNDAVRNAISELLTIITGENHD
jgi:hypothetical protein